MTLEMRDRENLERGRIAGHEEARNEMIRNALNKGHFKQPHFFKKKKEGAFGSYFS